MRRPRLHLSLMSHWQRLIYRSCTGVRWWLHRALLGRNECNDEVTGWSLSTLYNGMGKLGWRPPASAAGLWDATLK